MVRELYDGHLVMLVSGVESYNGEETLKGFESAFLPDPEQAGESLVDLIDEGQVFVAFGVLDFIHADGTDRPVMFWFSAA